MVSSPWAGGCIVLTEMLQGLGLVEYAAQIRAAKSPDDALGPLGLAEVALDGTSLVLERAGYTQLAKRVAAAQALVFEVFQICIDAAGLAPGASPQAICEIADRADRQADRS